MNGQGTIAMMKNHDQNQIGEESVYVVYTSTLYIVHQKKEPGQDSSKGEDMEAGADAEPIEGLTCSS